MKTDIRWHLGDEGYGHDKAPEIYVTANTAPTLSGTTAWLSLRFDDAELTIYEHDGGGGRAALLDDLIAKLTEARRALVPPPRLCTGCRQVELPADYSREVCDDCFEFGTPTERGEVADFAEADEAARWAARDVVTVDPDALSAAAAAGALAGDGCDCCEATSAVVLS